MGKLTSLSLYNNSTTTPASTGKNNGGFGGGLEYLGRNLGAGIVGIGEGIYDYVVGGIAKAVGNDKYAQHLMDNDIAGRMQQKAADKFNPNSAWEFAGQVASGIGQSTVGALVAAGAVALAPVTGGSSLAIGGIAAGSTIGLGAAGQSTAQAYQKTGELGGKEFGYGAASGVLEGALEGLTGAAGRVGSKVAKQTARSMAKKVVRKSLAKDVLTDAAGEFVEESLSEFLNPYLERGLKIDENAENATAQQIFYAGLVGAVSGALMSGTTNVVISQKNTVAGAKAIKEGKVDEIIAKATDISKYVNEAENAKLVAPAFRDMTASLNAYNKEANKNSPLAQMYLGEVQRGVAKIQTASIVQKSYESIIADAENVAKWYNEQGQNITAEQIRADEGGLAMRIAVSDVVGKMIMPDITNRSMDKYISTAEKELARKGVISDETNADIVDAYRQMERLNSNGTIKEEDYRFKPDYKITAEDLKGMKDVSDLMKTKGLLAENYNSNADRNMQNNRIQAAIAGGKTTVAEIKAIQKITKKMGVKVRFDNIENENGVAFDGAYENGTISIDVRKANVFSRVAMHEYIHHLAANAKAEFARVRDAVKAVCEAKGGKKYKEIYDKAIADYKKATPNKSDAYYEEEAICRVVEQFISEFGKGEAGKVDLANVDSKHIMTLRDFFRRLKERIKSFAVKKSNDEVDNVIKALDNVLRGDFTKKTTENNDILPERYNFNDTFGFGEIKKDKDGEYLQLHLYNKLQTRLSLLSKKKRSKFVDNYIKNTFRGIEFTLTDDSTAIVTGTGASKISHTKFVPKLRVGMELNKLFAVADLFSTDENPNHDKFARFDYYKARVKIGNEKYECVLNVGTNIRNNKRQIYDVNQFESIKKRGVTADVESVSSTNATSEPLNNNYAPNSENVNTSTEKSSEPRRSLASDYSDIRYSSANESEQVDRKKITADMSDKDRYEALKDKQLRLNEPTALSEYMDEDDIVKLSNAIKSRAEKYIYPLAERLGLHKIDYKNSSLDFEFGFSKNGGLKESLSKQKDAGGNYADFAKVLTCLDKVVQNAELIEIRSDKYAGTVRADRTLRNVYVLMGCVKDINDFIPVQFEVKEKIGTNNQLYLSVALTKIKDVVLGNTESKNAFETTLLTSFSEGTNASLNVSISDLFSKINPKDEDFLKYIPDGFLNAEQKAGKQRGIEKEKDRISALTQKAEPRKSIAGQSSHSANHALRDKAVDMMIQEKSAEEIYAETGFFMGLDGNMRYEIDDSKAKVSKDFIPNVQYVADMVNSAKDRIAFLEDRIKYDERQIADYQDKIDSGEYADFILDMYRDYIKQYTKELKQTKKDLVVERKKVTQFSEKLKTRISFTEEGVEKLFSGDEMNVRTKLPYIFNHDTLYEAYPILRTVDIRFEKEEASYDAAAEYNKNSISSQYGHATIAVQKSAFYQSGKFSLDQFKSCILHEVQHIIQAVEGFTEGTSVEEWKRKLREEAIKEFNAQDNVVSTTMFDTAEEYADAMVDNFTALRAYWNTYGEQEARNVEERMDYTPEQRAKEMPFKGTAGSKFAEEWRNEDKRYSLSTAEAEGKALLAMPTNDKSSKLKGVIEDAKDTKISFLNTWVNAQAGIEKYCKKLGIANIEATTNYARSASAAANYMIGKELRPVFEAVRKGKKSDTAYASNFMAYLLHWHNTDRMAAGIEKPVFGEEVSAADSKLEIAEYDRVHPEFKAMAEKVWAYSAKLLKMQMDGGLISQELYDTLQNTYPHYVPTYRDTKGAQTVGAVKGKGFVEINRSIKRAKGSDLDILPIDVMLARRTMQVFKAVRMNEVVRSLRDAGNADKNAARVVEVGRKRVQDVEIDKSAEFDADTGHVDYGNTFRPKDNQVTFFENGEAVTLAVSKDIFTGIDAYSSNPNSEWNNPVMNFTTKWNSVFKKLVTAYNPFFTVRNMLRDLQEAGMYTKSGWTKFIKNFGLAYQQIVFKGKYWLEYQEAGGLNSSVFDYEKGYKRSTKGLRKAMDAIELVNIAVEQAPRLAEFISSRESGLGIEQSLLNAADVTVNFGRGGTFAKKLNSSVIPFLNPSIQGFDKLMRTVFGKKTVKEWVRLIVRAALLGIGASLLNDLLLGDDDEYKALRQADKENNFIIKVGEGKFLKLPKGRVNACISQFFYVGKQVAAKEDVDWKSELENISTNMSPVESLGRFVWSPFTDVASNRTWYGSAIETASDENLSPKNRYNESTSSIAIALGKAFRYSPKKINYLLDQYSGVLGDFLLPATTQAAEKGILEKNFILDSTTQSKIGNEFYGEIEEITYAKNDGDLTAKAKLRFLNRVKSKIEEMSDEKKAIQNSDLDNKDKLAQTRTIQTLINNMMNTALTNVGTFEDELSRYEITEDTYDAVYLQAYRNAFGAEAALEQYDEAIYAKGNVMNKVGVKWETYFDAYFTIKATTNDYDKKGNVVEGSRKAKVTKYINSLKGLSKVQKAILLASAGYTLDATLKAKVKAYAKTMTEEEKALLYSMCGIKV